MSRGLHLYKSPFGEPGGDSFAGTFERWLKGFWGWSVSLRGSSVKGTWRGGLPPRDPKGYLEKSLGRVSLYIRAPLLGNLEEESSTGDSE